MGATRDDFTKYPRTPHLFGTKGTDNDQYIGRKESEGFIADPLIVGEAGRDERRHSFHHARPDGVAMPRSRDHRRDASAVRSVQAFARL